MYEYQVEKYEYTHTKQYEVLGNSVNTHSCVVHLERVDSTWGRCPGNTNG